MRFCEKYLVFRAKTVVLGRKKWYFAEVQVSRTNILVSRVESRISDRNMLQGRLCAI